MWRQDALHALQTAAEAYMTRILGKANILATHAKTGDPSAERCGGGARALRPAEGGPQLQRPPPLAPLPYPAEVYHASGREMMTADSRR